MAEVERVKIFHDRVGNSLVVWFGNPEEEYEVEETGDEILLMKDREGGVIGVEKLNFLTGDTVLSDVIFHSWPP